MSDLGLFPQKQRVARSARSATVNEPVTLKPYVPRPPIQYVEATREELIAGKGGTLVYDTECFNNLFMVAFKNVDTKTVTILRAPFDETAIKKLRWIMANYTVVSFNGIKYDLPLLNFACQGKDLEAIKSLSNDLIGGVKLNDAVQRHGLNMGVVPAPKHIDLIEVAPSHGGLKLYGGRLHAKRIQDVPWSAEQTLEDWQIDVTINYCINDLEVTELMLANLKEQLALREELSKEYKQNLMSKSDAAIAEAVIASELQRLTKRRAQRSAVKVGAVHKFVPPKNMSFQTDYMKNVLRVVTESEFVIDDKGYLVCPKQIDDLKVEIGSSVYMMGIGGLHSSETTVAHVADANHVIRDHDCASYYPNIILNCELFPKSLGRDFLDVYRSIVTRRLAAKAKAGSLAKEIAALEKTLASMP